MILLPKMAAEDETTELVRSVGTVDSFGGLKYSLRPALP